MTNENLSKLAREYILWIFIYIIDNSICINIQFRYISSAQIYNQQYAQNIIAKNYLGNF